MTLPDIRASREHQEVNVVDDGVITRPEFAALAKVAPETTRRWAREGYGPPVLKLGRLVRYRRSSVLAWLAAQEQAPAGTDAA